MIQVIACLALIGLGMGVDAFYQSRIRRAECDAYETGYQQGKKEERIREEARCPAPPPVNELPSMAAPKKLPDGFADHMRKHGRAVAKMEKGC